MTSSIAERIIKQCGGAQRVAEIVGCSDNWVYRWKMPKAAGGTGGLVPRKAQEALLAAAAEGAVDVTPADFFDVPQHDRGAA